MIGLDEEDLSLFAEIRKYFILFKYSLHPKRQSDIWEIGKRLYKGECTKIPADDLVKVFQNSNVTYIQT